MSSDHIEEMLKELLRRTGLIETGIQNLGTRLEAIEIVIPNLEARIDQAVNDLLTTLFALRAEMVD